MTVQGNTESICHFIRQLASSLSLTNPVQFEIASLIERQSSDSDSDLSGFDSISDGEYACRMYLAEEIVKTAINDNCSDVSFDCSEENSEASDSDSTRYELSSSNLSECVQGINDSVAFIDNIDTDLLSNVECCDGAVDDTKNIDDDTGFDDDTVNDERFDDDDDDEYDDENDIDYIADESKCCDSPESDDIPLAKIKKGKNSKRRGMSSENVNSAPQYSSIITKAPSDQALCSSSESEDIPLLIKRLKESMLSKSSEFDNSKSAPQLLNNLMKSPTAGHSSLDSDNLSNHIHEMPSQSEDCPSSFQSEANPSSHTRDCSITQSDDNMSTNSVGDTISPTPDNVRNSESINNTESQSLTSPTISGDGPSQVSRSRKRKRDPSNWKRNIAKRLCNSGEAYVNPHGIHKKARKMKKTCGVKCRYQCTNKFSNNDREKIFHSFWQLSDVNKQRQFILNYTVKKPKKNKNGLSDRRKSSVNWFLSSLNEQGKNVVCKTFFLNTLGISDRMVDTAHKKMSSIGMSHDDNMGKHATRPNKTSEEQLNSVREHINSYQRVESHYCRHDSKKEYLPHDLSEMYRQYLEQCDKIKAPKVSFYIYSRVFNEEFNIAFHIPLKDQCDFCNSYANSSEEEKEKLATKYESDIKNKLLVQEHKEADKTNASSNPDLGVCCFA